MEKMRILVLDFDDAEPIDLANALASRGLVAAVGCPSPVRDASMPWACWGPGRQADLLLIPLEPGAVLDAVCADPGPDWPAVALLVPPGKPDLEAYCRRRCPDALAIRAPNPDILASFLLLVMEKRRTDLQLTQTRSWLDAIFKGFDGFVYMCSPEHRVEYMNERLIARTGYNGVGRLCHEVLHDRTSICPWCVNDQVFAGQTVRWELRSPKDGRWFSIVNIPVRQAHGGTSKLAMILDITEYKRIQDDLLEATRKYQDIFDHAMEGIFQSTAQGRFLRANPAMARILGYESPEELLRSVADIGAQLYVDPSRRAEFFAEMCSGRPVPEFEVELRRRDGSRIWAVLAARPVLDASGKLLYSEGIMMDITDRKLAEDKVRRLTRQVLRAHETERRRISRHLHDQVAQDLASLKILLETASEHHSRDPDRLVCRLAQAGEHLGACIDAVRGLAYALRPPALDQLGLAGGLSEFATEFSRTTGIEVEFRTAGMDAARLEDEAEINLYCLVREALWNVYKHAGATRVLVRLVASHPNLIMRIEDNGRGFDVQTVEKAAIAAGRLGLLGMRERAAQLGGAATISSRPGVGTRIKVEVPLAEEVA